MTLQTLGLNISAWWKISERFTLRSFPDQTKASSNTPTASLAAEKKIKIPKRSKAGWCPSCGFGWWRHNKMSRICFCCHRAIFPTFPFEVQLFQLVCRLAGKYWRWKLCETVKFIGVEGSFVFGNPIEKDLTWKLWRGWWPTSARRRGWQSDKGPNPTLLSV